MTHRDVSVSLIGIAAGIVLGAGSLVWMQSANLGASAVALLPDNIHSAGSEIYTKRTINQLGIPLRNESDTSRYPTIKKDETTAPAAADTMIVITPCTAAQKTVWKIKNVYMAVTPMNVSNTAIRKKMEDAFTDALDDYCDTVQSSSSAAAVVAPSETPVVDNNCEKYPSHTVRYSQCVLSEKIGKTYP